MNEKNSAEKYLRLKRTVFISSLTAVGIFVFDSFIYGAPAISMFVGFFLLLFLLPATLFSIRNKPRLRYYGCKLIIYTVLVGASVGFYLFDLSIARSRAEVIIAAAEQYHDDKGGYPETLQQLVPDYLAEIPAPRIAPGRFYYLGAPEEPHLMYVEFPPFGRVSWSFNNKEWISID